MSLKDYSQLISNAIQYVRFLKKAKRYCSQKNSYQLKANKSEALEKDCLAKAMEFSNLSSFESNDTVDNLDGYEFSSDDFAKE